MSNPSYRKYELKIEADIGQKLKRESSFLALEGEYEKVLNLAFEQGIKLNEDSTIIKSYKYSVDNFLEGMN